ncbi:hypothetical protein YB2330_006534 [Saitoella coloradoensis]
MKMSLKHLFTTLTENPSPESEEALRHHSIELLNKCFPPVPATSDDPAAQSQSVATELKDLADALRTPSLRPVFTSTAAELLRSFLKQVLSVHISSTGSLLKLQTTTPPSPSLDTTTEGSLRPILVQSLRVLGNACIDTDPTRLLLLPDVLPCLLPLFAHPDLMVGTIAQSVFVNLCTDCPAAQKAAREAGAVGALLGVVERESEGGDCGMGLRGLGLLLQPGSESDQGSEIEEEGVERVVRVLLGYLGRGDVDVYERTLALDAVILGVGWEGGKRAIDTREGLTSLLRAVECAGSSDEEAVAFFADGDDDDLGGDDDDDDDEDDVENEYDEDAAEWTRARKDLDNTLASIEFTPSTITSTIPLVLLPWLQGSNEALWTTACVLLGNVALDEERCLEFVQEHGVHTHLFRIIRDATSKEAIHFAAGFLRNLAVPARNKDRLAEVEGCWDVLRGMWTRDGAGDVGLRVDGVAVARMLVNQNLGNAAFLMMGSEGLFEALMNVIPGTGPEEKKSSIDPRLEIERARTIVAVLRTLHFARKPALLMPMTRHQNPTTAAAALRCLVTQSTWPALRAEGFLGLALLGGKTDARGRKQVREVLLMEDVGGVVREVLLEKGEKGVRENARACVVGCTEEEEEEEEEMLRELRAMAVAVEGVIPTDP